MQRARWIILVPVALLAGIAGSLIGGSFASSLGQAAADTGSAFAGPLAFVLAAGSIAPSQRQKVAISATAIVSLLALGTVVLSTFSSIEEFTQLSHRARFLSPLAQILGAVLALYLSRRD